MLVIWINRYSSIKGNVEADLLARDATENDQLNSEFFLTDILTNIRRTIFQDQNEQYVEDFKTKGKL